MSNRRRTSMNIQKKTHIRMTSFQQSNEVKTNKMSLSVNTEGYSIETALQQAKIVTINNAQFNNQNAATFQSVEKNEALL